MTSTSLFGQVDKFDAHGKESFTNYLERLEFYFIANGIEDDTKKKAMFLSSVGAETFKLIKDLCTPVKPMEKTFDGICTILKDHLNPEPNVIVERYKFFSRNRRNDESVAEYVAELRHLSTHCNFGETLNDMIRDRIVCGVNSAEVQKKLLSVGNTLTLDKALKLAIGFETASKNAENLPHGGSQGHPILKVGGKTCFQCGGGGHESDNCSFKGKDCFFCKKVGHTARMCRKKKSRPNEKESDIKLVDQSSSEEGKSAEGSSRSSAKEGTSQGSRANESASQGKTQEEVGEIYNIYRSEVRGEDPILVKPMINGRKTEFELDSGAALTVMGQCDFKKKCSGVELDTSHNIRLRTFSGEVMKAAGRHLEGGRPTLRRWPG